jgi:hypothetical protein
VALTQAHPALVDRLRTASPGQLMEPFRIEGWWVVVRLEQLTPAVFDEATANQMTQELLDQWLNEEVERRIAPIRASLPAPVPQGPQADRRNHRRSPIPAIGLSSVDWPTWEAQRGAEWTGGLPWLQG